MELRSNQVEPVRIGIDFFQQKKADPSIIVAPTAFGKSLLVAKIAESIPDNVLCLQPSAELLSQNIEKFTMLGGKASIYSASFGSKRISKTTYATIGSIKNIGKRFKEMGFTKMICDECDRYPRADGMIGQFLKDSGITHCLGLTATPLKLQANIDQYGRPYSKLVMLTSNSKKGRFYKDIISVSQIQDIVKLGYWAKLHYEQYDLDETGLRYNSTMADFTEESVKKIYESNDIQGKIIQKVIDLDDRKSILIFVPSIADAQSLASRIPGSYAVYSGMENSQRNRVTDMFKAMRVRVVINVGIYSVGFDHPQLDCIIDGYPTGSLTLYYQRYGRGTRIHPLKTDCLIVDFAGNVKRFGRIEHFYYEKEGSLWKLYGQDDVLLSGIPIHEIGKFRKNPLPVGALSGSTDMVMPFGKHIGKKLSEVPKSYFAWMLGGDFSWKPENMDLKQAIEKMITSA
jgi:DNA repair protein RadD